MTSHWRIFTDAKSEEKALRLYARLMRRTPIRSFEPPVVFAYPKGGYTVGFTLRHDTKDWPTLVFDVLCTAQRLGHGWHLTGFVADELDMWATGCSVAGVSNVHVFSPGSASQTGG